MFTNRRRIFVLVAVASTLVSVAVLAASAATKHTQVTAPADLYLAPGGSDSGRCTRKTPCATFARAFSVARPGQVVDVEDGFYGDCSKPISGKKSDFVTFRAAKGAVPWTTCPLTLQSAEHIRFVNLRLDGIYLYGQSQYITLSGVRVTCRDRPPFRLYGPTELAPDSPGPVTSNDRYCDAFVKGTPKHFRMIGGSVGPTLADACVGADDNSIGYSAPDWIADDLVFDGVTFHGARFRGTAPPGCTMPDIAHTELLYLTAVRNVTIKNSYFYDGGSSADIFITDQNQGVLSRNILIQNNVFGRSLNVPIDVSNVQDLKISYNTFPFGGPGWIAAGNNVSIVGNLASHNLCPAPPGIAAYSHNVWFLDDPTGGSADRCGPTDIALKSNGDNIFVRMALHGDFHLRAGSPALGRGDPASFPARDRAGTCRPQGKLPDAGAFEREVVKQKSKARGVDGCPR